MAEVKLAEKQLQQRIVSIDKNVTGYDALKLAGSVTIAKNKFIDGLLQSGEWQKHRELFPAWTGTVIIYEAPGRSFDRFIRSEGILFGIPKEYQRLKNSALVLESPNLKVEERNDTRILTEEVVKVIKDFPVSNGWYGADKETVIPQGEKISSTQEGARYLWRRSEQYIGPVARSYGYFRRDVLANYRQDDTLGVARVSYEEAKQQTSVLAKGVEIELLRRVETSVAKLEETSKPELLKPIKELLRNELKAAGIKE